MPDKDFEPTRFKGKKTVYVKIPNVTGVFTIWDWSEKRNRYLKRETGIRYYAYKKMDGHQETKCFASLTEAKDWQRSDAAADEEIVSGILFGEVKERFLQKHKAYVRLSTHETLLIKMRHLEFFDRFPMKDLTPKTIDAWLEFVKQPKYLALQHKTRTTYHHELGALRQILGYYSEYICEDNSYSNPVKKRHRQDAVVDREKYDLARKKNQTRFLPKATLSAFLAEMKKMAIGNERVHVFYLIARFQSGTGTRIGEAAALAWKDVDLISRTAYIHRTVAWSRRKDRRTFVSPLTKTGEAREIPTPDYLIAALKEWKIRQGGQAELIFSTDGRTPLEYRAIQHLYDKALAAINSEWRGTHIMRHSFATNFLEQTQSEKALQGILGHQTSEQTNHYAKITNQLKRKAMDAFSDPLGDDSDLEITAAARKS